MSYTPCSVTGEDCDWGVDISEPLESFIKIDSQATVNGFVASQHYYIQHANVICRACKLHLRGTVTGWKGLHELPIEGGNE